MLSCLNVKSLLRTNLKKHYCEFVCNISANRVDSLDSISSLPGARIKLYIVQVQDALMFDHVWKNVVLLFIRLILRSHQKDVIMLSVKLYQDLLLFYPASRSIYRI